MPQYDVWFASNYGDDESPNTIFADFAAEWNAKWAWPRFKTVGRLDEPFERLERDFGDAIPTLRGEMTSGWHAPRTSLPLDFVYAEPGRLDSDTETRNPDGVPFRVFTLERTLVECFRARNKIGVGVAAAALREASDSGRIDFARLSRCMEEGRMVRVMAPYVEALA